jgi:serine/threonine-protein kinase
MAQKNIAAALTPSDAPAAGTLISLPADVLEQSCKRVAALGVVLAVLWAFALFKGNVVTPAFTEDMPIHGHAFPWPGNLIAIVGLGMSLGLVVLAGRLHHRPNFLLDLSLGFYVATALLIGILNQWQPELHPGHISWICVVILAYPAIAPNTPGKILVAGLIAASMDPLGLLLAGLRGAEMPETQLALFWSFLPNYICALIAVVPAHIIRGLGRHARKARELGSYKLGEELGRGGMGEVYRAEHRLLARQAAIKLIRPEVLGARDPDAARVMVTRFKREAQAAATLRSPHTIELYDFGMTQDGAFYYVMELLDGIGLDQLVERFGPIPAERAVQFAHQAALSLAEAHARGLIHRDIKPSNIFTSRMGLQVDYIKVLDFGLVKAVESRDQALLTAPQMTTGTPAYMAPELALGESNIDGQADIYALGAVIYWLLTGKLVFDAESPVKMMYRHVSDPPEPPSQHTELAIPDQLEALIMACLAKSPGDRPGGAGELAGLLAAIPVTNPWTEHRALRWWETHLPETPRSAPCDRGELAAEYSPA